MKVWKTVKKILGVILALAAVAGICYAVYKYLNPEYDEEFIDDLDDEFDDDDFFEDEDAPATA